MTLIHFLGYLQALVCQTNITVLVDSYIAVLTEISLPHLRSALKLKFVYYIYASYLAFALALAENKYRFEIIFS